MPQSWLWGSHIAIKKMSTSSLRGLIFPPDDMQERLSSHLVSETLFSVISSVNFSFSIRVSHSLPCFSLSCFPFLQLLFMNFCHSLYISFLLKFFLTPWHFSLLSPVALVTTLLSSLSSCYFSTSYLLLSGEGPFV